MERGDSMKKTKKKLLVWGLIITSILSGYYIGVHVIANGGGFNLGTMGADISNEDEPNHFIEAIKNIPPRGKATIQTLPKNLEIKHEYGILASGYHQEEGDMVCKRALVTKVELKNTGKETIEIKAENFYYPMDGKEYIAANYRESKNDLEVFPFILKAGEKKEFILAHEHEMVETHFTEDFTDEDVKKIAQSVELHFRVDYEDIALENYQMSLNCSSTSKEAHEAKITREEGERKDAKKE